MIDSTPVSIRQYAESLATSGTRIVPGGSNTFWQGHESRSLVRMPTFALNVPDEAEIRQTFTVGQALALSYIIEPDDLHPANTCLYICQNGTYNLESLGKNARRDIRRAQRTLRFEVLSWPILLAHGAAAFGETRQRVGLSDGGQDGFMAHFSAFSRNPAHHAVGAWKDDQLIAFMSLVICEDWVEIQGSFSTTDHRDCCPNDGLCDFVLNRCLVQQKMKTVSYGLSSVQADSGEAGLHQFKTKIGFTALPAHRAFVLHPRLRPLINPLTLRVVRLLLRLRPGNRPLKKAAGMLTTLVGRKTLPNFRDEQE